MRTVVYNKITATVDGKVYSGLEDMMIKRSRLQGLAFSLPKGSTLKSELTSITKKMSDIVDAEVATAVGGTLIPGRSGKGVVPDNLMYTIEQGFSVSETKAIKTTQDAAGKTTKANKIKTAGGSGVNLSSTKELFTGVDVKTGELTSTDVSAGMPDLVEQLLAAKNNQSQLKKILSNPNSKTATALRKNFVMKSGDIRIPINDGNGGRTVSKISFKWRQINANKAAKIVIKEQTNNKGVTSVLFNIEFSEPYVREAINKANKKARMTLENKTKSFTQALSDANIVFSQKAIDALNNTNSSIVFEVDKGSARIGTGTITRKIAQSKKSQSPQQAFISGVALSALVRARLQQTMATAGEAFPPMLKNRTGRYIESIQVFPNYRKNMIMYTLNPVYRSLEKYGYIPDGQAIVAIRQVTQALYARQFNILRAT
jgi:hypothetical protein